MKSGLFDINGKEISIGDNYVNPNVENGKTYTVFFKAGCFCGGLDEQNCVPLAWEYDDDLGSIEVIELDYIKII